jgi:hypothetical protein
MYHYSQDFRIEIKKIEKNQKLSAEPNRCFYLEAGDGLELILPLGKVQVGDLVVCRATNSQQLIANILRIFQKQPRKGNKFAQAPSLLLNKRRFGGVEASSTQ